MEPNIITDEGLGTLDINMTMNIPAMNIPGMRWRWAKQMGWEKNILMKVHGGLGDQVCCEPTLRFALETFKDVEISLFAMNPELFSHLKFKNVFDMGKGEIPQEPGLPAGHGFALFDLYALKNYFITNFIHHENCHAVDFPCLVAFQSMVPEAYREIKLKPSDECFKTVEKYLEKPNVIIHAGKSWPSKTFPVSWWDSVIRSVLRLQITPVLIGRKYNSVTGTVNVNADGCIDLRDQLNTMETVALLQKSKVLLTNDSSPLHLAASGNTYIGYVSMARRPEYLSHMRSGISGWRMENFSKGGIWQKMDFYLNAGRLDDFGDDLRDSWLPDPEEFAYWAVGRI